MTESTNVSLNLQSPNISTVVYAVQNDRSARHIVAQLLDGSSPWTPPFGAAAIIRYLKPDGTGGFYDTDDNDDAAVTITGSVADLTLVEQTLTVAGDVYMQLNFYATDGTRLTTFAWILRVQPSVLSDATIVSSDYFNALTEKITEGAEVASHLTFPVPIGNGGTGATTVAAAKTNLGVPYISTFRQQITVPYTALSDGIVEIQMRLDTTGRGYVTYSGSFVGFIDGYNTAQGYITGTRPVKKGSVIDVPSSQQNIQSIDYYWTSFSN